MNEDDVKKLALDENIKKSANLANMPVDEFTSALYGCKFDDKDTLQLIANSADKEILRSQIAEIVNNKVKASVVVNLLVPITTSERWDKENLKNEPPALFGSATGHISQVKEVIDAMKPVEQWSDEQILLAYARDQRDDLEFALIKRSKNRRFVIVNDDGGIDIDASVKMLKKARREEVPSMIVPPEGEPIKVYKVDQWNPVYRVRYESPLREGVTLFDDYCPESKQNFSGISDDCRSLIRLIKNEMGTLTRESERHIVKVARAEGEAGLAYIYPEVHEKFVDMMMVGKLPSLRTMDAIAPVPSDPFHRKNREV